MIKQACSLARSLLFIVFLNNKVDSFLMTHPFELFGWIHWTILGTTLFLPMAFAWSVRKKAAWNRSLRYGLATSLILSKVFSLIYGFRTASLTLQNALPMHLCDWAAVVAVIALIAESQLAYDLAYFWGLAGTSQAILTPDLKYPCFSLYTITFFISHCGIVVSVLFLTWTEHFRPTICSLKRAFWGTQIYFVCTLVVNYLVKTNYGYLAAKPETPSLLDYFGPWPWYILGIQVIGFLLFVIFYSPFAVVDYMSRERASSWGTKST